MTRIGSEDKGYGIPVRDDKKICFFHSIFGEGTNAARELLFIEHLNII